MWVYVFNTFNVTIFSFFRKNTGDILSGLIIMIIPDQLRNVISKMLDAVLRRGLCSEQELTNMTCSKKPGLSSALTPFSNGWQRKLSENWIRCEWRSNALRSRGRTSRSQFQPLILRRKTLTGMLCLSHVLDPDVQLICEGDCIETKQRWSFLSMSWEELDELSHTVWINRSNICF